jgi:hypothetical protein
MIPMIFPIRGGTEPCRRHNRNHERKNEKKNQKKGGKDNFPKLINLANEILIS